MALMLRRPRFFASSFSRNGLSIVVVVVVLVDVGVICAAAENFLKAGFSSILKELS